MLGLIMLVDMKQRCLPVVEIELIAFKRKSEYDSMTIITAAIHDKFPN